MATIAEIRQKYPQYSDLSDSELADSMHRKFYSDMPREDFNARIGLGAEEAPSGVAWNAVAGVNDAIATTLGAPVDLTRGAINLGMRGIGAVTGTEMPQMAPGIGGREAVQRGLERVGIVDPDTIQANTVPERIARGAGEGVGYMVAPEMAVAGMSRVVAPRLADLAGTVFGRSASVGQMGGNMVAGATGGATSVAAQEAVPERYKPIAGLAGGLVGGGLGVLAIGIPRAAAPVVRSARDAAAPLTRGGRERRAGERLASEATSPQAVREALDTAPRELVPGSRPTTFQVTGDMGLGRAERGAAARAPDEFMARRGEQNTARLEALRGVQPEGAPEAVPAMLRAQLQSIDQETQSALDAATQAARTRTSALGGEGTAAGYGDTLRTTLRASEDAARTRERGLWSAVDPDGTLALPAANTRQRAAEILQRLPASAARPTGEEADIYAVLQSYGDVVPFSEITALRSRLSTAMREEQIARGDSPVYARLSQLRGAIEADLETAVSQKAAQEAEAVAAGTMRQEDTLGASLLRASQNWMESRSQRRQAGGSGPTSFGGYAGARSQAVPDAYRTEGQARGGPGSSPGDPRLPQDVGSPNFDEDALGRLREASTATRERAQTFGRGTRQGAILQRSGRDGPYRMESSVVPQRLFFPHARSAQAIAEYRAAVGDDQALTTLQDYAASQLRKTAEQADGTLDPRRVEAWRRRHQDALRAFPELDARFADAATSSEAMGEVAAIRRQAMDQAQAGTLGRLMGVNDPQDVTRTVGAMFSRQDAAAQMSRLRASLNGDPQATEGLRKSIADYITGRFVSNTEAGTTGQGTIASDTFQTFVRQNRAALRQVFSEPEYQVMQSIAADLQRANRSVASVKLPGGSNTSQDTIASGAAEGAASVLSRIMTASLATGTATTVGLGPVAGAGAAAVTAILGAARQAGLNNIDEIVKDALLNPDRARVLLSRVPDRGMRGPSMSLMQRYRRAAATLPAIGSEQEERRPPLEITVYPNNRAQ